MNFSDCIFTQKEKIVFALRQIFSNAGYKPYKMSKFEEYDLYAKNKDFLVSDNVITFTDTNGKLLALKPDVTLSIIKNSKETLNSIEKVFYAENVYRVSGGSNSYQEIMQTGLECFGNISSNEITEVINLAKESLCYISNDCTLSMCDLDIIEYIVNSLELSSDNKDKLYNSISQKNIDEIRRICTLCENSDMVSLLIELMGVYGKKSYVIDKLLTISKKYKKENLFATFIELLSALKDDNGVYSVDFSILSDINYYNGIVFKGYIKGIPDAVLSGGRYDKLMKKMSHKSNAIGFAVYTDLLDRLNEVFLESDDFINVALPKGRLGEKVYSYFEKAGFECPSILENNRKLIFENPQKKVRYFWVKPSDVAIYVERGAADVGVAGKDIILEYKPQVYELLDLNVGKCKMAVAGKKDFIDDNNKTLRVATKFSNIARDYYQSKGRDIDVIHLNGSIEIAPILSLSDVIVDIVETGTTLKENDLEVKETILPISARLISNKASFKFKSNKINEIVENLAVIVGDKND